MSYRIKTVSELTGIPKNTIVAWERRYGLINPERQPNGYRTYTDEDVALLVQVKAALEEGLQISEAVRLMKRQALAPRVPDVAPRIDDQAFVALRQQLARALLAFDRSRAEEISQRLVSVAHATAIDEVYFPLLRSIGDGWERGEVTVAQEHFASNYVREQLIAMLLGVRCGPIHGIRVACTTFPGDQHELGVLGLAVMLATTGCRVTYLGANTPLEALSTFAVEQSPAWICVSVITPVSDDDVSAFGAALRTAAAPNTRIALGGNGLSSLENASTDGVLLLRDWHEFPLLNRSVSNQ